MKTYFYIKLCGALIGTTLLLGCDKANNFDKGSGSTNGTSQSASNLGSVNVTLEKIDNLGGDFCELYVTVDNRTNINFTNLNLVVMSRDASGNISSQGWFNGRVIPGGSSVFNSQWKYCSSIKSLDFKFNSTTQINGNFVSGADEQALMSIPIYTKSKVGYIVTTPKAQETVGSQNVGSQSAALPARTQAVADCAIVTMTMGVYNKQTGNIADGDKLLNYALAWGQTAFDVGATEGVSAEAIKAENKRLSANVASNMAAFMQTAPSKMDSCVTLLKSDSQILSMWQRNRNQ